MSNIDKKTLADDESVKTYYIHPAAFGSTKNPGYGHVAVVHADDFEKQRAKLEAAEKRIAELENDEVRQRLANAEQQLHIAELEKYNLRAKSKAQFRKRKAAELRVAELEAVKFKLSDPKLLSLAKDIVENLVDTGGSDPEYTQQYVDWTFKRIRAAAGKGDAS